MHANISWCLRWSVIGWLFYYYYLFYHILIEQSPQTQGLLTGCPRWCMRRDYAASSLDKAYKLTGCTLQTHVHEIVASMSPTLLLAWIEGCVLLSSAKFSQIFEEHSLILCQKQQTLASSAGSGGGRKWKIPTFCHLPMDKRDLGLAKNHLTKRVLKAFPVWRDALGIPDLFRPVRNLFSPLLFLADFPSRPS